MIATTDGIYMRATVERPGHKNGTTWLYLCSSDDLNRVLAQRFAAITDLEPSAMGMDVRFQRHKWTEAQERAARRTASQAQRLTDAANG